VTREDVLRHDEDVRELGTDEGRVGCGELDEDLVLAECVDGRDLTVLRGETDLIHQAVLQTGREGEHHVLVRQGRSVAPLHAGTDREHERRVVLPRQLGREPRVRVATAGRRDDDERLVDRAAREVDPAARVRVEVPGERAVP
jgi:hypothetical protein